MDSRDERAERTIRECWNNLVDNLIYVDLHGHLFEKKLVTSNQASRIRETRGEADQIGELLNIILRDLGQPDTFQKFLDVLERVNKKQLKKKLEDVYNMCEISNTPSPNSSGKTIPQLLR